MLQRQIMFKQLQELQRKQQLEELGSNKNQNSVHQLSSVKQASGAQFPSTVDETSVHDASRMFTFGNMQTMQHNGPSGSVISQNHNLAPQFDLSSYGIHAPHADENLEQYSLIQGPSNLSVNMPAKSQSNFDSSCTSQIYNFSSDQISSSDGLLISNQENNFSGQVRAVGSNSSILSGNHPQRGFAMHRNASFLESEKRDENAASLDPLEHKILYNADDSGWESAFRRISKMNSEGFKKTVEIPSTQSGSWSALMQSAVAESSSSDAGVQEEWSGLSFQNPEPLNEGEKLQNDWVDRNLQSASSPSSKPDDMVQSINTFTNFQQSSHYLKQKEEFQRTGGSHLIQESLPSPNIWPVERKEHPNADAHQPSNNFSGHEFRGTFWPQGSTSDHMSGIGKNYNQMNICCSETSLLSYEETRKVVNQLNYRYSTEPENLGTAAAGVSNDENVTAPSMDDTSNYQTPSMQLSSKVSIPRDFPPNFGFKLPPTDSQFRRSYSSFPSLSMGSSSATPLSSHIVDDHIKYQHSAPPVQSHTDSRFPAYGGAASKETPEIRSSNSNVLEFPLSENLPDGHPSSTTDMLQHVGFLTGLPTPPFPANENSFQHDYQQLEKGNSVCEGPTEINSSTQLSRNIREQELIRKHRLEENAVESGPSTTSPHEQASNPGEIKREPPSFRASDVGSFRHSLNQTYSPLHQVLPTRSDETDGVEDFSPKIENVNNNDSIANARDLLLNGLRFGVKNRAKNDSHAFMPLGAFRSGEASSMSYNQNSQTYIPNHPTRSNDSSNLTYQSNISSQMAPSWFKHYETLKNGHILAMYDAGAQNNAAQLFGEMTRGNFQENSLITQVNLANASQQIGVCAPTSMACKQNPTVLPSHGTYQNLAVSIPKKRKHVALDMIPCHKEVNHWQSGLQDISTTEYLWAEASNRKPEQVNNVANIVEEMLPVTRAKRRLISTTQLMQQVFRPAPVIILCSDASPNCDCVAYFAARLALGDAWGLTSQLAPPTNNMSVYELKTSKRTKACKFSKVAEAFIDRVKIIEAHLSRVDRSLSFVDIKVEASEMEKFSTINRFAKFHVRAIPSNVDPASSSGTTTLLKSNIQKYVVPLPMPKIVPEGQECLSL
ncbi:hypothetical protein OROGR_018262 [Orobanche gracilis]